MMACSVCCVRVFCWFDVFWTQIVMKFWDFSHVFVELFKVCLILYAYNPHLITSCPSRRGDEDEEYEEENEEVQQSPEQSLSEHDDHSATFAYKKVIVV